MFNVQNPKENQLLYTIEQLQKLLMQTEAENRQLRNDLQRITTNVLFPEAKVLEKKTPVGFAISSNETL